MLLGVTTFIRVVCHWLCLTYSTVADFAKTFGEIAGRIETPGEFRYQSTIPTRC